MPFALTGSWAGGGAIVGSEPVAVADDADEPFATLDRLPALAARDLGHPQAVGGGWFGWLGYRLGGRIERLPAGPPRPVAMPEFHLAYYDNVLRRDPDGQWWFEALVTEARRAALDARLRHLGGCSRPPSARTRAPVTRLRPPTIPARSSCRRATADHHLDAVADCRRRIVAGEIFQANICLRLERQLDGSAAELLARARARSPPPYAAAFDTPRRRGRAASRPSCSCAAAVARDDRRRSRARRPRPRSGTSGRGAASSCRARPRTRPST